MNLIYNKKKLSQIGEKYHLKFIILHGSYATGRNDHLSDLDIAVLKKNGSKGENLFKLQEELSKLFSAMNGDLDFKTLHKVDPFFRFEVIQRGILLYGDRAEYEEFKAFAHRAYEDAEPLLKLEQILIRKYQKHLNKIAIHHA